MAEGDGNVSDPLSKSRIYERFRALIWIRKKSEPPEPRIRTLESYFSEEYQEPIFNALDIIERDVLSGEPIHWNKFRDVMRGIRVTESTVPSCVKFIREILSFLERYQCRDANIISEVFLFMFFLTMYKPEFSSYDICTEMKKSCYIPYGEEDKIDLVWNSMVSANQGLLKLQLRFGMEMMAPRFTQRYCLRHIQDVLWYWPQKSSIGSTEVEKLEKELSSRNVYTNLQSQLNPQSWDRQLFIFRMLEIFSRMLTNADYVRHLTECYRLLFDSVPEAYVKSVEVRASLEKCLPNTHSNFISKVTEDFERVCPESAGLPEPRSLQHLSRIQIRQSLGQNRNLPYGVSSLPLPTDLKEYVMLHDDGDYGVIRRTYVLSRGFPLEEYDSRVYRYFSGPIVDIPEGDDSITSFLKNL